MGKNFDSGNFLLGMGQGTLSGIDEAKKQKQDLMLAMIKSGMYQPAVNAKPQGFLQRLGSNMLGPNLASQNPNLLGMPFQQVTPQMQADQMKQQMAAYGNILGTNQGGNQGGYQPSFSIDPQTGRLKSISMKPPSASNSPLGMIGNSANMSPDQLREQLSQTNPAYSNFLKNVYEGKVNLSGRSSKFIAQVMQDAGALYPDFDQSTAPARFKTRQDFTSGKAAANIKALNTAVDHLNSLNSMIPSLGNVSNIAGIIPGQPWNAIKNAAGQAYGDPSIPRFNMIKSALSGELATIFKNSGGTDQEINNIARSINSSQSPEQMRGVVQKAVQLMRGRMNALQDQWRSAFGENADFNVVSPRSKKILEQLAPEEGSESNSQADTKNSDPLGVL